MKQWKRILGFMVFTALFLALFSGSALAVATTHPEKSAKVSILSEPEPFVWADSDKYWVRSGDTFTIVFNMENMTDVYGVSLDLKFNPDLVNIIPVGATTAMADGSLFSNSGKEYTSFSPFLQIPIDGGTEKTIEDANTEGYIDYVALLMGEETGVNVDEMGSDFVSVTFEVVADDFSGSPYSTVEFNISNTRTEPMADGDVVVKLANSSEGISEGVIPDNAISYLTEDLWIDIVPANTSIVGAIYNLSTGNLLEAGSVTLWNATDPIAGPVEVDADGHYIFTDVPPGDYYLVANSPEFDEGVRGDIAYAGDELLVTNVGLYQTLMEGQYRVTTQWYTESGTEVELDSHLLVPSATGGAVDVTWDNKGNSAAYPYAVWHGDFDYNQEDILINNATSGTYSFAVNDYFEGGFDYGNAWVNVYIYDYSGLVQSFELSPSSGYDSGSWWHVFDAEFDGSQFNINPVNVVDDIPLTTGGSGSGGGGPVITSVYLEDYYHDLPAASEFNAIVEMEGTFLDLDHMDVVICRESDDAVVARSTDANFQDVYNGYTSLIYKFNLLQAINQNDNYYIDVEYDGVEEIGIDDARNDLYNNDGPEIIKAEVSDYTAGVITYYTVNIPNGAYQFQYRQRDESEWTNTTINIADGIGIFSIHQNLLSVADYFWCSGKIMIPANGENGAQEATYYLNQDLITPYIIRETNPEFLQNSITSIPNFKVNLWLEKENLAISDIEYVKLYDGNIEIASLGGISVENGLYNYGGGKNTFVLSGTLSTPSGSSKSLGSAELRVKLKNSNELQRAIPLQGSRQFVDLSADDSEYVFIETDDFSGDIVDINKDLKFTLANTDVVSGEVVLCTRTYDSSLGRYLYSDLTAKNIATLTKTTAYGYVNTYKGSFSKSYLNEDTEYVLVVKVNNSYLDDGYEPNFMAKNAKYMYFGSHLGVTNTVDIVDFSGWGDFDGLLGIDNPEAIVFKVVSDNGDEITIPASLTYYQEADYSYLWADFDFQGIAPGVYGISAYENGEKINISGVTSINNMGTITTAHIQDCYSSSDTTLGRYYTVTGDRFDLMTSGTLEIYKKTYYFADRSKLVNKKTMPLSYAGDKNELRIYATELSDLTTGEYTFIWRIDGDVAIDDNVTIVNGTTVVNYALSLGTMTNGTLELSASTATAGQLITVTAMPNIGYKLVDRSIKVNGVLITGTTFTMPAGNVVVTAQFVLNEVNEPTGVINSFIMDCNGQKIIVPLGGATGYAFAYSTQNNLYQYLKGSRSYPVVYGIKSGNKYMLMGGAGGYAMNYSLYPTPLGAMQNTAAILTTTLQTYYLFGGFDTFGNAILSPWTN